MPRSTSAAKVAQIAFYGGAAIRRARRPGLLAEAERLARERATATPSTSSPPPGGHRLARQQQHRRFHLPADAPEPQPGAGMLDRGHRAGTGGTSATIGSYLRYQGRSPAHGVVDPSARCFDYWQPHAPSVTSEQPSRIGASAARVEPRSCPASSTASGRARRVAAAAARAGAERVPRWHAPPTPICGAEPGRELTRAERQLHRHPGLLRRRRCATMDTPTTPGCTRRRQ